MAQQLSVPRHRKNRRRDEEAKRGARALAAPFVARRPSPVSNARTIRHASNRQMGAWPLQSALGDKRGRRCSLASAEHRRVRQRDLRAAERLVEWKWYSRWSEPGRQMGHDDGT